MKSILKYILLTAIRDWLYAGLFISLIAALGISSLLGSTSLVEKSQMTIVYMSGSSRLILALGIILFVCFHIHRSFENKEVEFILSKSIPRYKFICSYLLGFSLVTTLTIIPLTLIMILAGEVNKVGLGIWILSLFLEINILVTFAILATLILRSIVSAILATIGFYILARMMGFFVLTIKIPEKISDINTAKQFLQAVLKVLSTIFPRLDLFAKSDWLIYGIDNFANINLILLQSAIYIPLMIFMAFYDFNRKQF